MMGVLKNKGVLPLRCCHIPLKATPWQQLKRTPSFFNRLMRAAAILLTLFFSLSLLSQEAEKVETVPPTDESLNVPPPVEEEIPLQDFTLNIFDVTRNDEFRLIEELVNKFPGTKEFRLTKATRGFFVFNGKVEKDIAGLVERLKMHLAARFQIEAKMPNGAPAEISLIYIPPAEI